MKVREIAFGELHFEVELDRIVRQTFLNVEFFFHFVRLTNEFVILDGVGFFGPFNLEGLLRLELVFDGRNLAL